jgi:acyl-CoA dehydrogenase
MKSLMAEQRVMLADTLARLLRDSAHPQAAVSEGWNGALWRQLDEIGLPLLLVDESAGGIGGDWQDAHVVAHAMGAHAVGLPVCEAMLARRLAARAGVTLPDGVVGVAPTAVGALERAADGSWRFTGTLHAVPWGRHLEHVVAPLDQGGHDASLLLLSRAAASAVREARNAAGEPRDKMVFDAATVIAVRCDGALPRDVSYDCALMRVGQIAGALEAVLQRSVAHAGERVQFGKPIGRFQAVQQQLAVFGAEVAAVGCAARAAFRSAALGEARFEIAAAKLRANLAIDAGTAIAHQVHGAIGFTHEHDLRHHTQRLWSWRSEFGNDRHWSETLGQAVIARGVDAFWADLTQRGDAAAVASADDDTAVAYQALSPAQRLAA